MLSFPRTFAPPSSRLRAYATPTGAAHRAASRPSGPRPTPSHPTAASRPTMFVFSLILFAAVLLALGAAAARGLADMDQILEVVDPDAAAPASPPRTEG